MTTTARKTRATRKNTTANAKKNEQRQAELEALQASITEQVQALRSSEQWEKFLAFASAFHHYSVNNLMLIMIQCPGATRVAGYRKWQELGRQVRKGEKSIRILEGREVITTRTKDDNDATEVSEQDVKTYARRVFFPCSVFDISQTDLIDPDAEDNSTLAHHLTGQDELGIFQRTRDYLVGQGWRVTRRPLSGGINGYTSTGSENENSAREIVIDSSLCSAQAAKTILHEAAHALLHTNLDAHEYANHRGIFETEAESVAYIVAAALGADTTAYSIGYIAGWSHADPELIKTTAANVLKAARTLLDNLTTEDQADAEQHALAA